MRTPTRTGSRDQTKKLVPALMTLMLEVVDRMIVVSERALKEAVGLFFQSTGHLVEGAAAAALAGALQSRESIKNRTICLIVSGANLDEDLKQEITGVRS